MSHVAPLVVVLALGGCHIMLPYASGNRAEDGASPPRDRASDSNSADGRRDLRDGRDLRRADGVRDVAHVDHGECTVAAECNDNNPCTDDSCKDGKCSHAGNSNPCDDGDKCTNGDKCITGTCKGTLVGCGASEVCSKSTGTCVCVAGATKCGTVCHAGWVCCPGDAQGPNSCSRCGTNTCDSVGKWFCANQKTCDPADQPCECNDTGGCTSGPCAGCSYKQKKSCNPDCQWGGCYG